MLTWLIVSKADFYLFFLVSNLHTVMQIRLHLSTVFFNYKLINMHSVQYKINCFVWKMSHAQVIVHHKLPGPWVCLHIWQAANTQQQGVIICKKRGKRGAFVKLQPESFWYFYLTSYLQGNMHNPTLEGKYTDIYHKLNTSMIKPVHTGLNTRVLTSVLYKTTQYNTWNWQ